MMVQGVTGGPRMASDLGLCSTPYTADPRIGDLASVSDDPSLTAVTFSGRCLAAGGTGST